jgi:YYY domain-containing protein
VADLLVWWLASALFGLIAWPALYHLLPSLPDRGYTVSRAAGLLVTGYLVWLLGFLHVLPNTRGGLIVLLALLGFGSAVLAARRWPELRGFWQANRAPLLAGEAVFLIALVAWAFIRAHNPEIASTEKPMDFAFLNSILRATYFPPPDPWLSGQSISYYYFGYLLMAKLVQLTGVPSAVGFNLALATLAGLAALGAYGLGYNLWRRRRDATPRAAIGVGLTAAFLLLGIGNLQGILDVVRARDLGSTQLWQGIGVNGALAPYDSPTGLPTETWWWWHSTRVINTLDIKTDPAGNVASVVDSKDYTITEFPFFSFMLGDLHPHVLALPFALLALAVALDVMLGAKPALLPWPGRHPWRFGFAALVLGSLGFLNSWDLPTYTAVYVAAFAIQLYWSEGRWRWEETRRFFEFAIPLGLLAVLLFVPFYLTFQSQASGLLPWRGPATQPQHFLIVWGPLLFLGLAFLIVQYFMRDQRPVSNNLILAATLVTLAPFVVWLMGDAAVTGATGSEGFSLRALPGLLVTGLPGAIGDTPLHLARVWPLVLFFGAAFLALLRWILPARVATESGAAPSPLPSPRGRGDAAPSGNASPLPLGEGKGEGAAPAAASAAELAASPARAPAASAILVAELRPSAIAEPNAVAVAKDREEPGWRRDLAPHAFALLLLTAGAFLVLFTELFFIKDVFGNRMNTVFKFYYQAWVLFAGAGAYGLYFVAARARAAARGTLWVRRVPALAWAGGAAALLLAAFVYPLAATWDKTSGFGGEATLDGLAFTRKANPGEAAAIDWLAQNVAGQPVVAEATGGQYSEFGRVSERTGLPTLLGWAGHESQWRGSDRLFAGRDRDIDALYGASAAAVPPILDRYQVSYIFYGTLERSKYPTPSFGQLPQLLEVAFRNQAVIIYRVKRDLVARQP